MTSTCASGSLDSIRNRFRAEFARTDRRVGETVGFQASGVDFPSEGCWEVTGKVVRECSKHARLPDKQFDVRFVLC